MKSVLPTLPDERLASDPEAGLGALSTERGCLPLKAVDVQARIEGLLARIELTQTFVNVHEVPLEATYIFPLPDRAAVTRFRLHVAGRVIEGQLRERGAARREYDHAKREGRRAAITEEERPGVFTLRVGNLPPGEAATVELTLAGPLPYQDGEVTFRFPLVVAPRYIPGVLLPGPSVGDGTAPDTDAVPDASRISPPVLLPGFPNPVRLSLGVEIAPSPLLPRDIRSSLHTVAEEVAGPEETLHFRLLPGERLNRDFILRFRLGADSVGTSLFLQPDADAVEGTFLLNVLPPTDTSAAASRQRAVVFVLDRSGSMAGWKMTAARRALARMVDTLTDRDRFTVLAFDDRVEMPPGFRGALQSGSDHHRFRAAEFLSRIDARGGTALAGPLEKAVALLEQGDRESRERILVLVTDGQVGNEDQILRHLGARLKKLRVFTLGIDRAVNAAFLRRLSDLGGGASALVESEARLDEVMDSVHRQIGAPVLTELRLESAGLGIIPGTVVPGRLPDLFAGTPVQLLGRYRGRADGSVILEGRTATGEPWSARVSSRMASGAALPSVWARARLRELEDRFVSARGERTALEQEILATSLRFGVLCRFTAYVAVDLAEVVNPGGVVHGIVQPVEQPAGWTGAIAACAPPPSPAASACPPAALRKEALPRSSRSSLVEFKKGVRGLDDEENLDDEDEDTTTDFDPLERAARTRKRSEAPSSRGPGLIQRLLGLFGRGRQKKKAPTPTPDRDKFRQRVLDALRTLQNGPANVAGRVGVLRSLQPVLEGLFKDLVNAGDRHPTFHRLGELLLQLPPLLAEPRPLPTTVENVSLQIEAALQGWLGTDAPPAQPEPQDRTEFWK